MSTEEQSVENDAHCSDCTPGSPCDPHWCCAACDAAGRGLPVPCDPVGEPIHGGVIPPAKAGGQS